MLLFLFLFSPSCPLPAQGPPGEPGKPGAPGKPGTPGADVSSGCWGREARPSVCVCARVRERSAACRQLRSELRPDCGSERGGARRLGAETRFLREGLGRVGGPEGRGTGCPPLCSGSSGGYPCLPLSGHSPLTLLRGAGAWLLSFPWHPLSEFRGRACRQREGQSPPNPKEENRERLGESLPAGVWGGARPAPPWRADTCVPTTDCCHWMAKNTTVL